MSDKDNTFKFNPKDINDKPHIERSASDEYTAARRTRHSAKKEKDNRPLIYVSIALMVALIAVIIIGIFVLSSEGENSKKPENEEVIDMTVPDEDEEETEEEEEKKEEKEVISSWNFIFDADSVSRENGKGYKISATFFDDDGKSVFSGRKVYITSKTDIRDNGKRVSAEAFVKLLSNQSGDMIFFEGTVNEGSNEVISIKYNSSEFEAEEEPEEVEEKEEPEKKPEEEKEEEKEETPTEKEEQAEEEKPVEEEKKEETPAETPQPEETPSEEAPAEAPAQ